MPEFAPSIADPLRRGLAKISTTLPAAVLASPTGTILQPRNDSIKTQRLRWQSAAANGSAEPSNARETQPRNPTATRINWNRPRSQLTSCLFATDPPGVRHTTGSHTTGSSSSRRFLCHANFLLTDHRRPGRATTDSPTPSAALIYLDYNRTTPVAVGVIDAMKPFWNTHFLLPDQDHPAATAVNESLDLAREQVAGMVNCDPYELVFTSGGTESNNLAILGASATSRAGHILISPIESDSVLAAAQSLRHQGWDVETLRCDEDGSVDPVEVAKRIRESTRMVCVQLANPFLGTIQPIAEIGQICRRRQILFHCDAIDAIGKIPVDVTSLGVDSLSISGHKFFGPKGIGALYVRRGTSLRPIMHGEPREMGMRPGSENVPGCIGIGAAAAMAARCAVEAESGLKDMRDELVNGLISAVVPPPIELAIDAPRLPNTVALQMDGDIDQINSAAGQVVLSIPRSSQPPDAMTRTLTAIGRTPKQIGRTLHLSIGWTTTRDEVQRAIELLADACDAVRR